MSKPYVEQNKADTAVYQQLYRPENVCRASLAGGRSSRFSVYPFTQSPWRLCNTVWFSHRFILPGACMCSCTCTNTLKHTQTHIQSTFLAASQWNTGTLPNVFGFQNSSPLSFPDFPPFSLYRTLTLVSCFSLSPSISLLFMHWYTWYKNVIHALWEGFSSWCFVLFPPSFLLF